MRWRVCSSAERPDPLGGGVHIGHRECCSFTEPQAAVSEYQDRLVDDQLVERFIEAVLVAVNGDEA